MDCCGLSSTGLKNVDANEITSDNITIFSNLNVRGYSFLNNVLVNNNSTFLSSLNINGSTTLLSWLNVSGFTTLNNNTNINGSLNISGVNVLQTLNNHTSNLSTLFNSNINVLQTLIIIVQTYQYYLEILQIQHKQ